MTDITIGVFVGSLRRESFSRKLAGNIRDMAPPGFAFKMIEIGHLPLYNQDFDDHHEAPESYTEFRKEVKSLDGVLFITPEYNRSVPAVLKNALDVASRPYGQNCWDNKPGAVFSSSVGHIGGFGANHHLRQCLVFLNVPVMQQPEVYLSQIQNSLDDDGKLKANTEALVAKAIDAYIQWFNRLTK